MRYNEPGSKANICVTLGETGRIMTAHLSDHRDWLNDILHDESFLIYMQDMVERYIPEDKFLQQALPSADDAEIAWELVSFFHRISGYPRVREDTDPLAVGATPQFWTIPPSVARSLYCIASRASVHSQLCHSIEHLFGRSQPLLHPVVEDLHAAAIRDGIPIDYSNIHRLVLEGATPRSWSEKIICNALELLGIGGRSSEIESFDTSEAIYERLIEGVPCPQKCCAPIPESLHRMIFHDETIREETLESTLARMQKWEGVHPLLGVIIQSDTIWMQQPFPSCNGLMEVILRWIFTERIGMPALKLVPLSKLRLDWEQGLIDKRKAPFPYGKAVIVSSFGIDSTPYLMQIVQFLSDGLDQLEETVEHLETTNADAKAFVAQSLRLNHRQQKILMDMIDNPNLTIDVGTYADTLSVAVSTARSDLDQLMSMGYCFTEYQGKKQVFWPRSNLGEILAQQ